MAKAKAKETAAAQKVQDERARALETTLASLEKQFGKGTVMKLGDQAHSKHPTMKTTKPVM